MSDLLATINDIFRDVFEDDDLVVDRDTTAADVAGWDSVQHINLVLRIEARFGIRLGSAEVADLQNVGDLIDAVARRQPTR